MSTDRMAKLRKGARIADNILSYLGGNRMAAMTGAKTFIATGKGLKFSLPSNLAANGINKVEIELIDFGLYNVRFMKEIKNTLNCTDIATIENIDGGMLRQTFEQTTGLAVSL